MMAASAMSSADIEHIGKYEILGQIAQGGMAQIYLARQPGIGGFSRRVVLKCILPLLAEEPRFVQMFMEEARLASQIHHPNVVQIFDVGEEDESYFITMEYIDGLSVGDLCATDTGELLSLEIPVAAEIVMQACAGLHAAHKLTAEDGTPLNLVHRDVSPQNLMVNTDGVVKLVDFGIAKAQDSSVTTRTGNIKGKYAYMSPEQVKGQQLDRRSDVFSLATVFFELLTGQRLFHRNAELAILMAIIEDDYPAAHEVNPAVPEELSMVILRALERDQSKRFGTIAEMGAAIRAVLGKLGHYTSPETLATFLAVECTDQLEGRKGQRFDHFTPANRPSSPPPSPAPSTPPPPPPSPSPAPRAALNTDHPPLPEIIDLPPPRSTPLEREKIRERWTEEPTLQAMKPLSGDPDEWVESPSSAPLPEPIFPDDDEQDLAEAPAHLLAPTVVLGEPSEPELGRFGEPTIDLGPKADVESAVASAEPNWVELNSDDAENEAQASTESLSLEPIAASRRSPVREEEADLVLPVEDESVAPPEEPIDGPSASRSRRVNPAIPVVLIVFVLAGAVAVYSFWRMDGPVGPPLVYAHPPSYDIETIQQGFGPLAHYLARRMNRTVDVQTTSSYEMLESRLLSGEIDFANLPALLYVTAKNRDPDLTVLAVHAFEGSQTDQSYIIARDDSGIRSVEQLEGRRFCYPDPRSTTGYLMPRRYLREKGLDPDVVLANSLISKGHVGVMEDIVSGRCDAGAVISSAWRNARDLGVKSARIRLVVVAGDVTRDVVCASPKLPASLTESLRRALLDFRSERDLGVEVLSPFFAIDRFVAIRPEVFAPIEAAARTEKLID